MNNTTFEEHELSDYERIRAKNIERNNARLRALGLITVLEEKRSNAEAWKRKCIGKNVDGDVEDENDNDNHSKNSDDDDESYCSGEKRRSKKRNHIPVEPSRKSRRLEGKKPELLSSESEIFVSSLEVLPETPEEREARVEECRRARLRAANEIAKAGASAVGKKENPTASYEHCLMRVRTMTEKRLATRVKVIEKAAGKHCVVKMAIFKSCLQDEGMWDLAALASDALERLKGLQAPPVE